LNSCSQGSHRITIGLFNGPAPSVLVDLSLPLPTVQIPLYEDALCGAELANQQPQLAFVLIGNGPGMEFHSLNQIRVQFSISVF
jgi:hypothetical protein